MLTKEAYDYGKEDEYDSEEGGHGEEHEGDHDENMSYGGPFSSMKMTQLSSKQILFTGYTKRTGDISFAAWEPEENHKTQ